MWAETAQLWYSATLITAEVRIASNFGLIALLQNTNFIPRVILGVKRPTKHPASTAMILWQLTRCGIAPHWVGWMAGWMARRLAGIRTLTGWLTHHCANCNIQLHTTVQIALQYSINSRAMTEQWKLVWHPGESLICVGMSRRRHRGTNLLSTFFESVGFHVLSN